MRFRVEPWTILGDDGSGSHAGKGAGLFKAHAVGDPVEEKKRKVYSGGLPPPAPPAGGGLAPPAPPIGAFSA